MSSRPQGQCVDAGRKVSDESGYDGMMEDLGTNENGNPTKESDDDDRMPVVSLPLGETADTIENSHDNC